MIIAHRGLHTDLLENTLESFLSAIESNVNGIEFDVQKCLTGEIIIFHDETIDRLTSKKYLKNKISEMTIQEIKNIDLIDKYGRIYKIPLLNDVLRNKIISNSNILINIEIKDECHETVSKIISNLIEEKIYKYERFLISSFHMKPLTYFDKIKLNIGYIISENSLGKLNLNEEIEKNIKYITHIVLEKKLINNLEKNNLKLFVFTVNEKIELNDIDGIITDNPSIF